MARPVQNSDASRALEDQFDLRGHVGIQLDEIGVPVVDMGDFAGASPFEKRWIVADTQLSGAAGAATYAGVFITPAVNTVLVIHHINLANATGANVTGWVKLFRPADVAACTVVSTDACARLNGHMQQSGFAQQGAATSSVWHHTTTTLGANFHRILAVNGRSNDFPFLRGIILDGRDPLGPIRLALQHGTLNTTFPITNWYATEYHLPR